MGRKGRQVIDVDTQSIVDDLNKAAAAELNDAFRYKVLAKLAEGLNAVEVADWLEKTSEDEWEHPDMWIERIISLGGLPFVRPLEAEKMS